jgi:hypothetical protein
MCTPSGFGVLLFQIMCFAMGCVAARLHNISLSRTEYDVLFVISLNGGILIAQTLA